MAKEYLDTLNEIGKKTGEKKLKEHIHRDGDWHACVQVIVINSHYEILLQKRSASKISEPNTWDQAAAGHVRAGEEPIDAAVREIEEEIGVKADKNALEFMHIMQYQRVERDGTYINNQHNNFYLLEIDHDITDLKFDPNETSELKFFAPDELIKHYQNKTLPMLFPEEDLHRFVRYVKNKAKEVVK